MHGLLNVNMISRLINTIFKKAALIAGCFFVWGCSNNFQEVRDLGRKKQGREEAYNITAYMSEGSKARAKLTSPYMVQLSTDSSKRLFPKTLLVEFYDDSARAESWLFAKRATYYTNIGKVLLEDSVVVYNIKGDTMHTNELWWDRNRQIFYNHQRVHILQPGTNLYGDSILSDQAFKNINIYNSTGPLMVESGTLPGK